MPTPYALSLLAEYAHTLDSLPIDISRNFADLRELDAVLSSSIHSITTKIHNLTTMIEEDSASKEDRLWLLTEISEDAQRLKLGGEDKIRVACQAADNLKSHSGHLRTLTEHIPGFNASMLDRKTEYPHVSERAYKPAFTMETGRRRRGGLGSIMVASNPDPSPAKRKRVVRDDDIDIGRSPKKPIHSEGNARGRTNARAKKTDRAGSPSESLVSIQSHLPPQLTHSTSGRGGSGAANGRGGNGGAAATNKRARAGANSTSNNRSTPLVNESYSSAHDAPNGNSTHVSSSRRGGASGSAPTPIADSYTNVPPSSSHPSLPMPYQNGSANGAAGGAAGHLANGNGFDVHGMPIPLGAQDWNIPRAQQLEGPGMPVARSASIHSTAASVQVAAAAVDPTDGGDGEGDGDDKTYCFCDNVSYGSMVGCDDENCEREWFHLACVGLEVPPTGDWFCDACRGKRTAKRSGRGGKRRAGGARAGARN